MTVALGLQSRVPGHLDRRIGVGITLDDFTRPEYWRSRAGKRFQAYRSVQAVAGQRGFVQVVAQAGVLAVLESAWIGNNSGGALSFAYGLTSFEAAVGGGGTASLDDRDFSVAAPGVLTTFGSAVAPAAPNAGYILVPNGVMAEIPLGGGVVLTGKANPAGVVPVWKVCANSVNVAFEVITFWRERSILPSEK